MKSRLPERKSLQASDSRSAAAGRRVLRARVVVPVSRLPMADAAVVILGGRIVSVVRWRELPAGDRAAAVDLGEVALLPGLVNAHCHLDYTDMAGEFTPPRVFTDWLMLITESKAGWGYSDFAASWLAGAGMLLRTGTTTVADIEAFPPLLPEVRDATPLRVCSFLEMTGVKSRRPPREILREALDILASLPPGRGTMGLSPHAPYSTTPELLRLAATAARRRKLRVATHVAESQLEFDMFRHGRGAMFDWLARSGRDMSDCAAGSPVQHLEKHGALNERLLAIHVNYLAPGDAELLARRKANVVHCPRSHAYFQHGAFPLDELSAAGVNVCLGTDSLASVYKRRKETVELSMFDEMRQLATAQPGLAPGAVLQMATLNGARALGMRGRIGELSRGACADLIAIPFEGKAGEVCEAAVQHRGAIAAGMIGGEWTVAPD